jgi:outer membrane immunogenic protein
MRQTSKGQGQTGMSMRKLLLSVLGLAAGLCAGNLYAPAARAQTETPKLDVGVAYNYIRANGPPGGCGCFAMNGGSAWVGFRVSGGFSAVGEFSGQYASDVNATGEDLALYSYLFGPRYTLLKSDRWQPFGQVLVGGAHASGTFEPSLSGGSGSYNSLAMVAGGGLDVHVSPHIGIRAIEADYYLTRFPNGVNTRQNNLRISAGFIFRF